jgi:hypothetical protein
MLWRNVSSLLAMVLLGMLMLAVGLTPPLDARDKADEEVKLPAFLTAKPLKPSEGDSELRKLQKERYNAAVKGAAARYQEYLAGRGTTEQLYAACRTVLRAELELADKPAEKVAVREKFLTLAKEVDMVEELRFQAGRSPVSEREAARVNRLTAEIELLQAREKAKAPPR